MKALENGQIDALVTDLPTAFYMAAAQLDKGKIVGQLPRQRRDAGAVRPGAGQGQPADRLRQQGGRRARADGTLDKLVDQWLSQGGAPVLN